METLSACAPVYGANAFFPVIDEIFDALKVEVSRRTRALQFCLMSPRVGVPLDRPRLGRLCASRDAECDRYTE